MVIFSGKKNDFFLWVKNQLFEVGTKIFVWKLDSFLGRRITFVTGECASKLFRSYYCGEGCLDPTFWWNGYKSAIKISLLNLCSYLNKTMDPVKNAFLTSLFMLRKWFFLYRFWTKIKWQMVPQQMLPFLIFFFLVLSLDLISTFFISESIKC